ncbi:primase [Vibrio phage K449]
MYLFYQESTKKDDEGHGERWKIIKDSPQTRESLANEQVQMVSMLAISSTDPESEYEALKYRGDLYFDIDNENLEISIASTLELVNKLEDVGVHDIVIYLSGKKGFHVTVPSKAFLTSATAGIKWLPYIYGHLAVHNFAVEGLDLNVYSGGRGRLWRQPNVKREDNGQYKVPITKRDLESLDVDSYKELASVPNFTLAEKHEKTDPTFSTKLSAMFEDSAVIIRKEQESKETYRFEVTPELEMLSEVPGCILKLADGIDVKEGTNFNRAAMNLAGYLKSANRIGSDIGNDLINRMSAHNNYGSASYTNERSRRQHLKSAVKRAKHDKSMGCNPAYILSTVERCGGCVVCDGTLDKKKPDGGKDDRKNRNEVDEDGLRHNIFEQGLAYCKDYGPRNWKSLTTFLIEPIASDIYYNQEHHSFRREAMKCNIKYSVGEEGEVRTTSVTIEEDAWDSPSQFKKQFAGIDNVAVTCSEDDLADLRHYIMSKYNDIDNSIRTPTIGLDIKQVPSGGKMAKVLVYTEPGYTASGRNVRVPVHYEGDDRGEGAGLPCIHKAPKLSKDEPSDVKVAKDIFYVNEHWICSTFVGWVAATSLKPHITSISNEFPLLSVTGRPGTGKTTVSSLMADLAGCTYGQSGEPASANSTAAAVERYIAGSTSTPRILDEVNAPAFRANGKLLETLKMCYNGLEVIKGNISGGSAGKSSLATRSVRMTGPLIYISEQPQQDDALRQRSIEVMMTMALHGTNQQGQHLSRNTLPAEVIRTVDAFEWVTEHEQRERLRGIGSAIIHESLNTPKSWVRDKLKHYAEVVRSARCHGRQKYGWRVILMGLDLYQIALKNQYGIDVTDEVELAKQSILARLLDESITDSGSENCNNDVLKFISILSERSAIQEIQENHSQVKVARDLHYTKTDCDLIIQIDTLWIEVAQQAKSSGTNLKYGKVSQFLSALKTEEYFIEYDSGSLKLDLDLMKQAGINVDYFYTDEEFEDKCNGV